MDPVIALNTLRRLCERLEKCEGKDSDLALMTATMFQDLDEWMKKEGFDPWKSEKVRMKLMGC